MCDSISKELKGRNTIEASPHGFMETSLDKQASSLFDEITGLFDQGNHMDVIDLDLPNEFDLVLLDILIKTLALYSLNKTH